MSQENLEPSPQVGQIGHADARFTLNVYTDVGNRRDSAEGRIGALIRGSDWAPLGTTDDFEPSAPERPATDSALESV